MLEDKRKFSGSGQYTKEEDAKLLELFEKYSNRENKWKIIADELKRSHKSVRERYVNHLDKTIDKSDLTNEEKREIDDFQTNPCYNDKYHKKWAQIAKKLSVNKVHGRRTELQVKNYWNSKNRVQRRIRKNKNEGQSNERIRKKIYVNYILTR